MDIRHLAAAAIIPPLVIPLTTVSADAASVVRISYVQYNSPGSDTGANKSLNAEWVRIHNYASTAGALTGWTLRDAQGHVYRFDTFRLGAGKSVRIHTGKGSNTSTDRYWSQAAYVWNNTDDEAILRNKAGTTVDTCGWGDGDGATAC